MVDDARALPSATSPTNARGKYFASCVAVSELIDAWAPCAGGADGSGRVGRPPTKVAECSSDLSDRGRVFWNEGYSAVFKYLRDVTLWRSLLLRAMARKVRAIASAALNCTACNAQCLWRSWRSWRRSFCGPSGRSLPSGRSSIVTKMTVSRSKPPLPQICIQRNLV